jgi:hypothetical protein
MRMRKKKKIRMEMRMIAKGVAKEVVRLAKKEEH